MRISNNESLEDAFYFLHFCDLKPEKKKSIRKAIKEYYKKNSKPFNTLQALENDVAVEFYNDYDSMTKCYYLNNEPTKTDLHEYWKSKQISSLYDCTGKWFLFSIHSKKLHNGKTLITESWELDI